MISAHFQPPSNLSTATTISIQPDKKHRKLKKTPESPSEHIEHHYDEVNFNSSAVKSDVYDTSLRMSGSWQAPSTGSSLQTREKLRSAERKVEELQKAVKRERALNERLKHEVSSSAMSAAQTKIHALKLEHEMHATDAESSRKSREGLFKEACSTDLLFLIDTTFSMHPYIEAAKEQVKNIVDDITRAFFNEAEVRIAVVAYKDHSDKNSIQFLDFTRSANRVHTFLSELSAVGGNDIPEDVLGGIRQALNATWKHMTRCIIHIADAPPHGRNLHELGDGHDNYPEPGSEPHHLTHEPLLKQMIDLKINYALLRITARTDLMAFTFLQAFNQASGKCKLHVTNKYYGQACILSKTGPSPSTGSRSIKRQTESGLLFEEAELGTSYSALRHLVVKNVTASISRTAVRMSAQMRKTDRKLKAGLKIIKEDEDSVDESQLESVAPQWNTPGWLDEKMVMEGFSPVVMVHDADTLNNMMARDDNFKTSFTELTINRRSRPFAQGAIRRAFYARTAASSNRFVVKSFKRDGKKLRHFAEDMRCQSLCKAFALEFNTLVGRRHSLDFTVSLCLKGKSGTALSDQCISLEPFLEGDYVKYNTNWGYVNDDIPDDPFNQAAQAFSHFTFERSRGQLLVCDLQGVGGVLTDPGVHALDPERFKLAETNLGKEGFKFFFASHKCNSTCRKLKLQSNGTMVVSGKYKFREDWPSMNQTVCCSNKLCGRIIHLPNAHESEKYIGYRWCDECWLQLDAFNITWLCLAPGPAHEFEVSKFFYESQGQPVPRKCIEHRVEGMTSPRVTVVDDTQISNFFVESEKKKVPRNNRSRHAKALPTHKSTTKFQRESAQHSAPRKAIEPRDEGALVPLSVRPSDHGVSPTPDPSALHNSLPLIPSHLTHHGPQSTVSSSHSPPCAPPQYSDNHEPPYPTPPHYPNGHDPPSFSPTPSSSLASKPLDFLNTPYTPPRTQIEYFERSRPVTESAPAEIGLWAKLKTVSKKKSMRVLSAMSLA